MVKMPTSALEPGMPDTLEAGNPMDKIIVIFSAVPYRSEKTWKDFRENRLTLSGSAVVLANNDNVALGMKLLSSSSSK